MRGACTRGRDSRAVLTSLQSQIQIAFNKNLNEENGGLWFTKEELNGVPEDVIVGLEKGTGENEGKVKLSFKYPDLFPTLKFATNVKTRQKLFVENENKASQPHRHHIHRAAPTQCVVSYSAQG